MIKCKILPPRELYFPVLPSRINGKLIFPLCRTCADLQQTKCNHSIEEKFWHWEKLGLLFGEYVDMFLKGKQEADAYPDNVKTEEEKQQYIKDYYEREGVLLDANKIQKNKGLRSVMKMLLNSLWGRFVMNTNKTQYKVQVFYSTNEYIHAGSTQTSVVLAAFVTCHARLKLYEELKKIDKRVLYFDTDSIIYVRSPGQYRPILGDYLGDFTDEIKKKGALHIVEFISAGPKNYAYKMDNGKTSCTVKGITLNHISSLVVNFDSIRDIVLYDREKRLQVEQLKFSRDKTNWFIKTDIVSKMYGFVYDKRILLDSFYTLPYGKFTRTLNLNSHYLILFNNPRDRLQIGTLARQMFPNKVKFFMEVFEDAASKPNGYLLIDLKQSTEERNRIQTGITSDDLRIIYTSKD
ncbi:unnamed protein product [Brachionus calyciflorus]|uniref:DNA-directed DNA polymerase n=1 Tax=Brachionus calyciflorus TaxID=104777 RepID=A0A814F619_9BILA|nr:unnamed protein product [Brachionus calyciflorus]